jgi:pimeloyl-ACP methyl ester carboxylesterase
MPDRNGASCSAEQDALVVLLHGFLSAPWSMHLLARQVRGRGFATFTPAYDSWGQSFESIAARLTRAVQRRAGQHRPIHFIGHSMGGLVARAVAARLPDDIGGRIVQLGTPNSGSEMADLLHSWALTRPLLGHANAVLRTNQRHAALPDSLPSGYELGIIAGDRPLFDLIRVLPRPHDGKVSVASTRLAAATDHIVLPVTHAFMPYDRRVQRRAIRFLLAGRFRDLEQDCPPSAVLDHHDRF